MKFSVSHIQGIEWRSLVHKYACFCMASAPVQTTFFVMPQSMWEANSHSHI